MQSRGARFILIVFLNQLALVYGQSFDLGSLRFAQVVAGLNKPVDADEFPPGSGRFLISEQSGLLRVFDGQKLLDAPFLDLSSEVSCCGELGFFGAALHPRFEENGFVYVSYTATDRTSTVARFTVGENRDQADPESKSVVLTLDQETVFHKGGRLEFGKDGYLYISFGEDSVQPEAQNLQSWYGSILRIDVDSGAPYAIPPGNPFAGNPAALPEIWAFGLRNPWTFTFDRLSGDMFIADVGEFAVEELNLVPAGSGGGQNFGWPALEGSQCHNTEECDPSPFTAPIFEYANPPADCASIIAGYRYWGLSIPELRGTVLAADHCSGVGGKLYALNRDGDSWVKTGELQLPFFVSAFAQDAGGEVYLVAHGTGELLRLEADPPQPQLSGTSPEEAVAGGPGFTVSLLGSNFVPESRVTWNGGVLTTRFVSNEHLQAEIDPSFLRSAGAVRLGALNGRLSTSPSADVSFVIRESPAQAPSFESAGIVDAAGFVAGRPVAPGTIVAVFGENLAVNSEVAGAAPLPDMLGGGSVLVGGGTRAPLYAASPSQINMLIPWELAGETEATLTARVGGAAGGNVSVQLTEFSPALFTVNQTGSGQGSVLIAGPEGLLAAPSNLYAGARPARRGEYLSIYATGLGPVSNQPASGEPSPADPLARTLTMPTTMIGGAEAAVTFSGLAPGFVGLYQVNAQVPAEAATGPAVPLSVTIGGVESNEVTVAIEAAP